MSTMAAQIDCLFNSSLGEHPISLINTLRPRQIGRHLTDAIFKCIFLNEDGWIPITISLKFVPKGWINKTPALVQIMAWRRSGDKPLSEPMMVVLPTHICVTQPQWVNPSNYSLSWKPSSVCSYPTMARVLPAVGLSVQSTHCSMQS